MSATEQACGVCGIVRPLAELLEVVKVATGQVRFVCRPSVSPDCVAFGTGSRDVERIQEPKAARP